MHRRNPRRYTHSPQEARQRWLLCAKKSAKRVPAEQLTWPPLAEGPRCLIASMVSSAVAENRIRKEYPFLASIAYYIRGRYSTLCFNILRLHFRYEHQRRLPRHHCNAAFAAAATKIDVATRFGIKPKVARPTVVAESLSPFCANVGVDEDVCRLDQQYIDWSSRRSHRSFQSESPQSGSVWERKPLTDGCKHASEPIKCRFFSGPTVSGT